jgi:hypothetical protein
VDDADARRSGILADTVYEPLLRSLVSDLDSLEDVSVRDVCESPVKGNHGTLEFFLYIRLGKQLSPVSLDGEIKLAAQRALQTASYQKGGWAAGE